METLHLNIPYDKEEFLRTNEFRLRLAHKPTWRRANGAIILTSLFLVSTVLLSVTDNQNPGFVISTAVLCIVTVLIVNGLKTAKKKYLARINEIAELYERKQMDCIYEFREDGIYYVDKEKTMDLKWEVFKYYISHENYIIFSIDSFENAYFLSKRQIDETTYDKILNIAAAKLPRRTLSAMRE